MEKQIKNTKSNYIWNAIGSCSSAASTIIFLLITNRILGGFYGGIMTIALALGQQMYTVANFETSIYYVTDGKNKITVETHFAAKLLLALSAVIIAVIVASVRYDCYKLTCVILVCLYKIVDGISAFFYSVLQKHNRLDIAGKSLSYRVISVLVSMLISQYICNAIGLAKNTAFILSLVIMLICSIIFILTYELHFVRKFTKIEFCWEFNSLRKLIADCIPMFLGTFILTYICNQPKYVIDGMFGEEVQNSFGIVFIPAAVICLLGFFIYRPLLIPLTNDYKNESYSSFIKTVVKLVVIIFGLTGICIAGAYLLGIPVLGFVYNIDLADYKSALCIGILGGGMYAVAVLLYNIISIMRKQRIMLLAYLISFAVSLVITKPMTRLYGVNGAVWAYVAANAVLAVLLGLIVIIFIPKKNRKPAD